MFFIHSLYECFKEWLNYFTQFLKLYLKSSHAIKLENIALRSQLALYAQRFEKEYLPQPRPTPAFRQLWVFLSKHLENWKDVLLIVKPDTVIRWHRTAFKFYWKQKSKKLGRPAISQDTINLIKRVHKENPLLSPEKMKSFGFSESKILLRQIQSQSIFPAQGNHLPKNKCSLGRHSCKTIIMKCGQPTSLRFLHSPLMCYMFWSSSIINLEKSFISA